jgi:hypothetical protein
MNRYLIFGTHTAVDEPMPARFLMESAVRFSPDTSILLADDDDYACDYTARRLDVWEVRRIDGEVAVLVRRS